MRTALEQAVLSEVSFFLAEGLSTESMPKPEAIATRTLFIFVNR
jgi:hypothetical protein